MIPEEKFLNQIENDIIPFIEKSIEKEEEHLIHLKRNKIFDSVGFADISELRIVGLKGSLKQYCGYLAFHKYGFNNFLDLYNLGYTGTFDIIKIFQFFLENYKLLGVVTTFGAEEHYPRYVFEIRDLNNPMSGVNCAIDTLEMPYEDQLENSFASPQEAWVACFEKMRQTSYICHG